MEKMITRAVSVGPKTIDQDARSVEVIGATQAPVQISDWDRGMVNEVLLIKGCQLPKTKQVPLLDTHSRWTTDDVIGSYRDIKKNGEALTGRVYFDEGAVDQWRKVSEGHLTDFSVGYVRDEKRWLDEGEKWKTGGQEFEGPLMVVTKWSLKELSACPIGADPGAKARAEPGDIDKMVESKIDEALNKREDRKMEKPEVQTAPVVDVNAEREAAANDERERIREINAIAEKCADKVNLREAADMAIQDGTKSDAFRNSAYEKVISMTSEPVERKDAKVGMSRKDIENYSILRAIAAHADKDWSGAGLELEASRAAEGKFKKSPRGFFVPPDVLGARNPFGQMSKRELSTMNTGQYLVDTDTMYDSFIELLENKMLVKQLGATVLNDLVGDVAIPKETGAPTMYWIGENSDIDAESAPTLGQIGLTPKSGAAYTDLSRKLIIQSSMSVEAYVRARLQKTVALGIDLAALHGSGLENEPRGIANTPGINTVAMGTNGAAITWPKTVEFETAIAADNADIGTMAFLTNARNRGHMKTTPKESGYPIYMWEGSEVNGYPAYVSNQVRGDFAKGTHTAEDLCAAFFGNWAQLIIGQWSGLDILTDPYSLATSGQVRTLIFVDVDVNVAQPTAFAYANDIIA